MRNSSDVIYLYFILVLCNYSLECSIMKKGYRKNENVQVHFHLREKRFEWLRQKCCFHARDKNRMKFSPMCSQMFVQRQAFYSLYAIYFNFIVHCHFFFLPVVHSQQIIMVTLNTSVFWIECSNSCRIITHTHTKCDSLKVRMHSINM